MRRIIMILLAAIVLFSSCATVKFETSQPKDSKELKEFPGNLTGVYVDKEKDTMKIDDKAYTYGRDTTFYNHGTLSSERFVLKKIDDYNILSLKDKNYWEVIPFKYNDEKLILYYIDLDKNNEIINKLKEILTVKEIKDNEGEVEYYLIDPTKKEFETLLKKNIFSKILVFRKVK